MGSRRVNLFVILFVIGLLAASALAITQKRTVLGIDLRGGTQLVYEGEPTPQTPQVTPADIDRAIEIIRDRVDALGVAEPEISRLGDKGIQVSLPDVQDAARAAAQVGDTAQLGFYDLDPNVIPKKKGTEVTSQNLAAQLQPSLYDAVKLASEQPRSCGGVCTVSGDRYYLFDKKSKDLVAGPTEKQRDLFDTQEAQALPKSQQEILTIKPGTIVVKDKQSSGTNSNTGLETGDQYFVLHDRPALGGNDLKDPQQNFDPNTHAPIVTFDFTDTGRQKFAKVTQQIANRGQLNFPPSAEAFGIVLDDEMVSRPVVDPQENPNGIDGRNGAQISGGFSITEAQDLAEFLRIGALPIDLKLISTSTVSATLGEQALNQAKTAGLVGLALVMLFLVAYYRFLGLVAVLGLIVYAVFFFALMKVIPITLTLPGVAGLILTIGVAADSNIIIFERIKEEAAKGHSMLSAISAGYRRGIGSIIDANVITLLTAFVLFGLATGGVKGFAFTLGVGVLVSLFTAVVFTRAVLASLGRTKLLSNPRVLGAASTRHWHFDFSGASRWFFSMSGAILLIGAISFATQGLNFGIDFESGTKIEAALVKDASVDDVRSSLGDAGVADPNAVKVQSVTNPQFGDNVVQIQGKITPSEVGKIQDQLRRDFGLQTNASDNQGGFDSTSVGPTFGAQVARSAAYAIIFSLILISAYVAFRFEAKYAIPVLIAVIHDILITGGVYSLSGREVSSATVAAFLTILGYSLYDTVIVFDRIRENVPRLPRATFAQIANRSLSEVLTRSLITGLSTVFLIGVILVFGGETLRDFAFAMMIGVLSGTYSSIFIATPVLIAWKEREPGYRARAARIQETMGTVPPFPEDNEVARVDDERDRGRGGGGRGRDVRAERRCRRRRPSPSPSGARARGARGDQHRRAERI